MKNIARHLTLIAILGMGLNSCETSGTNSTSGESVASGTTESAQGEGVKPYPLSTCLVTGEGLNSKGTPITFNHKGQEIKVCCPACQMAFKAQSKVYLAKLP